MARHNRKDGQRAAGREGGVVALEFVILFPIFLLILVGIMEFGHLFYVRHTLTNATREGARAAVVLTLGPDRQTWAHDTATAAINNYLGLNAGQTKRLPGVTLDPYDIQVPAGTTGTPLTVRITARNVSLVLGDLVAAFKNLNVAGQTTMILE